ncbi:MAG: hypothetical protein RLZZ126_1298 [Pseudomonadota bacterium]|jgi:outer membrane protein assembly factor BamE
MFLLFSTLVKRSRKPQLMPLQRSMSQMLAAAGALAALAGCAGVDNVSNRVAAFVSPYKITVVQGNFVSKEQAAFLKPGMSRQQVREVLGTPLLTSIFHADRWDYPFSFVRQGQEPQQRRVTVFFKGDALERVVADALPSEAEFVASLDAGQGKGKVPPLEATPEQLAKIAADRAEAGKMAVPPTAAASAAPISPDRYPPLEPSR